MKLLYFSFSGCCKNTPFHSEFLAAANSAENLTFGSVCVRQPVPCEVANACAALHCVRYRKCPLYINTACAACDK